MALTERTWLAASEGSGPDPSGLIGELVDDALKIDAADSDAILSPEQFADLPSQEASEGVPTGVAR